MLKKVSIIVCTYNARDDLKDCLESLDKQEYDNLEIIIVDDASNDGTAEYVNEFQTKSRFKTSIVLNKENLGVAGSRNAGITHASGDIISFTDADCVVDPHWIQELIKGYDHDRVTAVGGSISDKDITNIWELTDKGHDFVASKEGEVTYIQGCNMSFMEDILKKFMFNDEIKYGYEEKLLCDRLTAAGNKVFFNPLAVVHHKRRNNMTSLLRRKYLLGLSSVWYRRKQKKLALFKRHFMLLISLLCLPFIPVQSVFLFLSVFFFLLFLFSLLRDEFLFQQKTRMEILVTFPFLVFIEFAHFGGALAGVMKFYLLERKKSENEE